MGISLKMGESAFKVARLYFSGAHQANMFYIFVYFRIGEAKQVGMTKKCVF